MKAEDVQKMLNDLSSKAKRPESSPNVFIVVPNMNELCVGLVGKMFSYARQEEYRTWFAFQVEKRHTDYARNLAVRDFLNTPCEWILMIDADVDPHKDMLNLIKHGKPIMSGNVFCWINGELMASIWQRAECEQCKNLWHYQTHGKVLDESQYRIAANGIVPTGVLQRWNPFHFLWSDYATKEGILGDQQCRCKGTGLDPWVFRTHQTLTGDFVKVDSVGSASLLIHRSVFQKIPFPWFRFLYRESGEILCTEDHYFCWKAQECGLEVWAHPKMVGSHYKTVDLLQLTTLVNKAFTMGTESEKLRNSVEVPA